LTKQRLQSRRDIILANPARRTREQRNLVQDSVFPCGSARERAPRIAALPLRLSWLSLDGASPPRAGVR
jgi:hypothetical protein